MVLVVGLLSGCGGGRVVVCTLIGCPPSIDISMSRRLQYWPGATGLRACMDQQCSPSAPLTGKAVVALLDLDGPRFRSVLRRSHAVEVSLEVIGTGGRVLFHARQRVGVRRRYPNGRGCGPPCYSAYASFDR